MKAKKNKANPAREGKHKGRRNISPKTFVAVMGICLTGAVFVTTIYSLIVLNVPDELGTVMYIIIAASAGAFISFFITLVQMFQSREDKEEVLDAIENMGKRLEKILKKGLKKRGEKRQGLA